MILNMDLGRLDSSIDIKLDSLHLVRNQILY